MLHEILAYVLAVITHWIGLLTGGLLVAVLLIYERLRKTTIPRKWFVGMVGACVLIATFLAWRDLIHANADFADRLSEAKIDETAAKARADEREKTIASLQSAIGSLQSDNAALDAALHKKPVQVRVSGSGSARSPEKTEKRRVLRDGLSRLLIEGQVLMDRCLSAEEV